MITSRKFLIASIAVIAAVGLAPDAKAQYVGGSEVTVLQGFKAGGGSDALAQLVQPYLAKELGADMVNQYIPGATGAIAWTRLAKQTKPDGKTISITNTPMLMTNYIMNESITYNIDELEPLANVVTDPGIIVVAKDSKYKTVQDLFDDAKANPGKLTIGNSGVGGDDYFSTIMVEKESGLSFQKVPFQGDGPSWQAAMGGKIDASFNNLGITFPQIKAGNMRALAIFTEERVADLPDVPTLKELGINVVAGSSRGYSAPKGIPAEAKQQFMDAMKKVAANPDFQRDAAARAMVLDVKLGDDYKAYLENQQVQFKAIWDEIKSTVK